MTLLHLAVLAALGAASGPGPAGARPLPPSYAIPRLPHAGEPSDRSPGIRVWVEGADLFHRGDRVRVYYRTERDAYVTIFRVDTDGRVQVLFPRSPEGENLGYAGATYAVSAFDRGDAFYVDDDPGIGYIFGVASADPFDYGAVLSGGRWDVRAISDGRIHGDPRAALEDLSVQLMSQGYNDYDTHLVPYYVEQHFDYPRFMCYDCHAYTPYSAWDPYSAWCPRFTLVLYNDPFYYYPSYWYPTRYYQGTRVVFRTGFSPRFVFSARAGTTAPGIAYRDRRVNDVPGRGPAERGARGTDVGGVGSIPAPRGFGRRTTTSVSSGAVDQPRGGTPDPRGNGGERGNNGNGGNGNRGDQGGDRGVKGRDPGPPPGEPTGRRESPGIEIVPRPSDAGNGRRNDQTTARETPKSPDGQPRGFTPGQAKPADASRPGEGLYGRRQTDESRPTRPDQSRPQGREMPPSRAPDARPSSPPPRSAPAPQAREAPRQGQSQPRANPRQEPQRGSNPQLTRRRP
jgi:hypothetical protein